MAANYMMDVEKQLNRQFSIALKGYTFEFKTNYKGYVKWADRTKRTMRRKAIRLCRQWAEFIAIEAKKRCPHYSGGLEAAIKVSGARGRYDTTDFGKSRMSIAVGVDALSWKSEYDKVVTDLVASERLADAQLASPELAILLHEQWESLAGELARKRAERKGTHFGVRVGSKFLTRAYFENQSMLSRMAVSMYTNPLAENQSKDMYASEELGMNEEIPF